MPLREALEPLLKPELFQVSAGHLPAGFPPFVRQLAPLAIQRLTQLFASNSRNALLYISSGCDFVGAPFPLQASRAPPLSPQRFSRLRWTSLLSACLGKNTRPASNRRSHSRTPSG